MQCLRFGGGKVPHIAPLARSLNYSNCGQEEQCGMNWPLCDKKIKKKKKKKKRKRKKEREKLFYSFTDCLQLSH